MLHELRVNNLALVDSLRLDVSGRDAGLIALTGETGAGKSIILQAVHLLGGGRSSASWVRNDCDQAQIEALFIVDPANRELNEMMEEFGLQDGGGCIIRRVITGSGRSRLYINDRLVTARTAGDLAAGLVNIAGQHDNQQLLNTRRHLDLLDSYGELWAEREEFAELFRRWQKLSGELRQLIEKEQDKEQQKDFLLFQLEEIEGVGPVPGEDEELIKERDLLRSSAALVELTGKAKGLFAGRLLDALSEARKDLQQLASLDPAAEKLAERAVSACYEVEDIEQELGAYGESIPTDTNRLEFITERLASLRQLQRKYGPTLEEVLAFAEKNRQEVLQLEDIEQQIEALELEVEKVSTQAFLKATELSQARKEAAAALEKAMEAELASLSFNQAVFRVGIELPEGLGLEGVQASGRDTVEFLFSANPGEPVKPLARIASGGELSRLMLAMKCILARRDQVDTVIFDEVDAGISGQAAEAVAGKIEELAGHHQVFCITHLPQIAARADIHFKIEKQVDDGRTRTVVKRLEKTERVGELARMLGGQSPTDQAMEYARELVGGKKKGEAA